MSKLSNGQRPGGKEPNPRRRRKKRRKNEDTPESRSGDLKTHLSAQASSGETMPDGRNGPGLGRAADKEGSSPGTENPSDDQDGHRTNGHAFGNRNRGYSKTDSAVVQGNNRHQTEFRKKGQTKERLPQFDYDEKSPEGQNNHPKKTTGKRRSGSQDSHRQTRKLYAALDLGTNNCRLLVALPQERGRFRVVDGFSRIVRLGEGLHNSGRLGNNAMDRALEALKICASKLRNKQIVSQRLIATQACRQAENGEEFLERVCRETGLELDVVDQETEARLAAEGCGELMDRRSDAAVLFDIGGGSSELILVDATGKRNRRISDKISAWTSLPMGVVTLAEQFGGGNISQNTFEDMISMVQENIESFDGKLALDKIWNHGRVHLLGTSGTVTTLAGVHLELPRYDRRKVDGLWLNSNQVDTVINRLLAMDYEERAKNPCIGKERADLVLAGCAILEAIRRVWPSQRLRVADRGLREGLLSEMINRDNAWIGKRKKRWSKARRARSSNKPSGEAT